MPFILSALVGLSLSAPAPSGPLLEPKAPAAVQGSLIAISRPLGFAGECVELHPELGLTDQFEKVDKKYLDALTDAEGVWPNISGVDIEMAATEDGPPFRSCRARYVQTALKQAEQALEAHARIFGQLTSKMDLRGAWLGPIQLCRETVESAVFKANGLTKQPALSVKLASRQRESLSNITGQSVGRPLAIRLDGSVIAKPVVLERLDMGELEVSGPEHAILARLAERTAESC